MNKSKIKGILFCLLLMSAPLLSFSQAEGDKQAIDLLEKAMGPVGNEEGNMGVYFEGITMGIQKPTEIFTLPSYKVYRGGFFFQDGKKYEMQIGVVKALCDGEIMVVVDEQSKSIVVDSLREKKPGYPGEELPDMEKLIQDRFGEMILKYEGKETVNGKVCHRIKGEFKNSSLSHVYYWVREDNNHLLLIGEWNKDSYDVYWIKKISQAPAKHDYSVNLPSKELNTFYGYKVFDFRFDYSRIK